MAGRTANVGGGKVGKALKEIEDSGGDRWKGNNGVKTERTEGINGRQESYEGR